MEVTSQQGLVGWSVLGFASKTDNELREQSERYDAMPQWERAKYANLDRKSWRTHKRFLIQAGPLHRTQSSASPHSMETRSKKARRLLQAAP
jgi:hypothetical protein